MPASEDAVILTLEVTGSEAERLGAARRKQFGADPATIGRAEDNDWVLPHALVSSHHARIDYADGVFYITDTSTNGVFFNSKAHRLTKGQPSPVQPGDTIIIEPFRICASVAGRRPEPRFHEPQGPSPRVSPPIEAEPFQPPKAPVVPRAHDAIDPFAALAAAAPVPVAQRDELDPLKLLGVSSEGPAARNAPRAEDLQSASALSDHFRPPVPAPAVPPPRPPVPLIPDDYDPASEDRESRVCAPPLPAAVAEPRRVEQPEPPREPARIAEPARPGPTLDLAAVLAGAGLDPTAVTPRLASHMGAILRVVVAGVMDVLQARQQIKDEFRMRATRFKPEDNNPLKFSANVGDALHNLLVKQNPAYLGPVEAFEDAFDDLRNHQMAMLAGMRTAFEAMLAEFDPERLQSEFDRKIKRKKSLLGGGPEEQYWEMYRERARQLAKDVEATFQDLFGETFVSAYEEQLDRLNARGRRGKR